MRHVIGVIATLGIGLSPVLGQAIDPATTGKLAASNVGNSPVLRQSGPDFVTAASDANLFELKAAELAVYRAERDDVKAYAQRVLSESRVNQKALLAALRNDQRNIKAPSESLSSERASMLKLLEKAPKGGFDNLYLSQATEVQHEAWGIYRGFALDGTDAALKQVAGTTVPVIEQELTSGKALLPSGLVGSE